MSILKVDGLVKTYSRRRVVDGVCLDVSEGEIVGLLGPNGAGKTTTFRMICGMVRPDHGAVFLSGEDVTQWPMYLRAREGGMGYLPQQTSVFSKLSARDNLIGVMQMLGFNRKRQKERCDELLEQFKISHIQKTKAGKLSGGERRRLEIARCLVSEPRIIMLDEPFAGIDPVTVQNIQVIIRQLADQGIAILITDHAAREILQTTDRTYVVSEGRILVDGTADQIVRHDQVREKYLGDIDFNKRIRIDNQVAIRDELVSESERVPALDLAEAADHSGDLSNQGRGGKRAKRNRPADVTFLSEPAKTEQPRLKQTDLD
ncbi:MAG: LPS export ABC transporter ATP-binding protein [Mariniblastus sp.]|nr:LPS export ABC transporter ATP-binding protein [Mariniblastus sp.]